MEEENEATAGAPAPRRENEAAAGALTPATAASEPSPSQSQLGIFKKRIHLLCDSNTGDFDDWVSLIRAAEETSANSIEVISLIYGSFLMEFPLCYGYWIQYAAHKARLCTIEDVVEVYEQAVQAVPHSVDLWVSYCCFGISAYEDPAHIRSVFERALYLVGKDYHCYHLWDKYIEFENSQKQLIQLATVYINTLKFPTGKLHKYYESFKKLVKLLEEVTHCGAETSSEHVDTYEAIVATEGDILAKISALFDQKDGHLSSQALEQYLFAGECLYQRSSKIDEEIHCFEAFIRRPFFHVRPLDNDQLENWHRYLDFVEKNGDFDWAVKLYERCLIPCANYSEFWIRYAEFVDSKGGREIANYALHRASSCFVKGVPIFSMYYAMFKEQTGDALGARSLFVEGSSNFTSDFCMNINRLANMEKRLGNTKAASEVYEAAIEDAKQKQNVEILPDLYTNFAQFKYVASHSIGEAKEIFVKGIKQIPCKSLIKGFIQFMSTHGGPTELSLLDSVISDAVIPGSDVSTALSTKDREDISLLFLEFVDLYGDVTELRKAWARHSKLFPHNTRDFLQRYQREKNNRRTESMKVSPDNSPEDNTTLKQLSKSNTCSMPVDKEVQSQVDNNTAGSQKGHRDSDDQNVSRSVDAHQMVGDTAQECTDMAHSNHSLGKSGIEDQINSHSNQEICHDLNLCEHNNQATKCHPSSIEKSPHDESCKSDSPSKSFAGSKDIDTQDKAKATDLSASCHPGKECSVSDSPSGSSLRKEGSLSNPVQNSPGLEEQPEKIQVKREPDYDVSVCNAIPEKSSDSADAITYAREISAFSQENIQSSQPHPLTVCTKPSSSEIATTQSTTCPNFSVNTAVTSQAQVQQQMANSQIYQSNSLSLVGQNMQQQQGLAYAMPQSLQISSQTQGQPFADPNQGNQQYLQTMQAYTSHMWKYYQQQMYSLQSQYNQQMQSLQQQHLPTEHLQQNFMQQVQQLNQQMLLWEQQVQQQQQQAQQQQQQPQPIQQQSDQKKGQHHLSSGDNKHERNEQNKQESQLEYQSQHWQQQQMLYFQQQQQQQMYLMQQQQMYEQQQQQQLMQQQLLQMPPHDVVQQQQLFQQQQQQLFQQQQQQMVLLQQQQQQFIQQQMQQHLQKKTNQEGFKDQNRELNPQSDGSKVQNAEQSEFSYPSTPQSQHSNH